MKKIWLSCGCMIVLMKNKLHGTFFLRNQHNRALYIIKAVLYNK